MTTYKIVRFYRDTHSRKAIRFGLTLEEAQAHCRDPETSSTTCTTAQGRARTKRHGAWFDGYEKES